MDDAPLDRAELPRECVADPKLLNSIAWSTRWRERNRSVLAARRALEISRKAENVQPGEAGRALRTLCWQAKWRGDLKTAETLGEEARQMLRCPGGSVPLADVESILGVVYYSRDRRDMARSAVARGFELLEHEDNVESRIDLINTEATIQRYMGHPDRSVEMLNEAMGMASLLERARVLHNMARHQLAMGQLGRALSAAMTSVVLARTQVNQVVLPYALEVLGAIQAREGRHDRARDSLTEGLALARADGDRRAECQILHQAGALACATGRPGEAITLLNEGILVARKIGYPLWEQNLLRDLAAAHEADGNLAMALDSYKTLDKLTTNAKN